MTREQLYIYTEEVSIHAQPALSSYQTFRNIVDNPESRQRREAWMFLQSFLSHFGMVSKLLFAPSGNARANGRAIELRQYLDTDDASALNDRHARNAIEHLDERMDNWLDAQDKGILEAVFESAVDFEFLSKDSWIVRRVFLLAESAFITEERDGPKQMPLQPLVKELGRLLSVCDKRLKNERPYHILGR